MRSEIHAAALRAAAKVAFSLVLITGCDDPEASLGICDDPENCTDAAQAERQPQVAAAKDIKQPAPLTAGCNTDDDASAPKPNCREIVDAAFPTAGDSPARSSQFQPRCRRAAQSC